MAQCAHSVPELARLTGLLEQEVVRYIEAYTAVDEAREHCLWATELRQCLQLVGYAPTNEELPGLVHAAQWEHILSYVDCDGFVFLMGAIRSGEVQCSSFTSAT